MILAVGLGLLGVVALAAAVLGFMWLVQFVVGNEERGVRETQPAADAGRRTPR